MWNQNENSAREIIGWGMAAAMAPLFHGAGSDWITAAAMAVLIIPLSIAASDGFGYMSKWMYLGEMLWLIPVSAYLLRGTALYWGGEKEIAVPLIILLLACGSRTVKQAARTGAVILYGAMALWILIIISGVGQIQWDYIPNHTAILSPDLLLAIMIPGLTGLWSQRKKTKSGVAFIIITVVVCMIVHGNLPENIREKNSGAFYIFTQTMHLGDFSRLEAMVAMTLTLCYYALASFLLQAGIEIGQKMYLTNLESSAIIVTTTALMICVGFPDNGLFLSFGSIIMWLVAPVFTLKNNSKKVKKMLDKSNHLL